MKRIAEDKPHNVASNREPCRPVWNGDQRFPLYHKGKYKVYCGLQTRCCHMVQQQQIGDLELYTTTCQPWSLMHLYLLHAVEFYVLFFDDCFS